MLKTANELGMKGIALTDHECLCGHLKWLKAEKNLKEKNILPNDFKAALGNEIYLVEDRNNIEKYWHYILIAKNNEGHRALRELSSIAWYNGFNSRGMMRVPTEKKELETIVKKYPNSLIATTACLGSELDNLVLKLIIAEKNQENENIYHIKTQINDFLKWNIELFGDDFYIEIAAGISKDQVKFNQRIGIIAKAYNRKIVIGSDSHYLTAKERPLHKAYLNSKEGEREVDEFYYDAHMMDNNEAFNNLQNIFSYEEFVDMCNASMEIYNKIEGYQLERQPIIPHVEVKNYYSVDDSSLKEYPTLYYLRKSDNNQERYWVNQCLESLIDKKLYDNKIYLERLEIEAKIIKIIGEKLNNCLYEYFNTFQHYINLFWECGSIVGPGRGSSVCFLSNYLLGITQLDPIKYDLLYFRFLNEDRIELPDIDLDICPEKRNLIFSKIREERGELNLIQVCTFGTEGTRSAIAAAGRGYRSEQYPNGLEVETTQYLSGLIPQERGFLPSIDEVINGNEEKDKKPIQAFIDEVNKYPGLLDIIKGIEGLVCRRGEHASGVMFYNGSPFETNAIMRSPNGDLTTQFELHDSDLMGDVKYDILLTSISSKITTCLKLLQNSGYIEADLSLRQMYDKYLHPEHMDYDKKEIWDSLSNGDVLDVFQFNDGVGLTTAKQIKPTNVMQMTLANALMRLQGEKGKERPADRYTRLKNNMSQWYHEVRNIWHLTEKEIKILEPYYVPRCGTPCAQEDMMRVCMDKNISHFTLAEANNARKIVGKKIIKKVPELKEKFITQCPNRNFGEYIWETTMLPQMSYAFNLGHGLAYSFVGIQTLYLAKMFPSLYWNCACLIINAGGAALLEYDEDDMSEDDDKKKNNTVDYGRIGIAIGKMIQNNIKVFPPDINKSSLIFSPDSNNNAIIYGLKGLTRIGDNLIKEIMKNRPYISIEDFLSKVKINKVQMISLIKSGAFDNLYQGKTREQIMSNYIELIADKKKRITLQNMQMLISKDLIPKELEFEKKLFNFNKYLKAHKEGDYYLIDVIAGSFFNNNYDDSMLEDIQITNEDYSAKLLQKKWDSIYKKDMEPVRVWMKKEQEEILNRLNQSLYNEAAEKYTEGNISKWEMDSLSFYYHEHELEKLKTDVYNINDYYSLSEEPEVERVFNTKDGNEIKLFKLHRIAGTVIDKNKNKNTVTLLTTTGVVILKIWKNQFAKWDKQLSKRDASGVKHIVEKSWFQRGTKLIITGIRRDDAFIPKKYKNTEYPLFEKIISMDDNGFILESTTERVEVVE